MRARAAKISSSAFLNLFYMPVRSSYFPFYCIILSRKFHLVSCYDVASEMNEGTYSRICQSASKLNRIPIYLHTYTGNSSAEDGNVHCQWRVRPRISPRILLISDYTIF
jgi:hypothetical protein